MKLHNIVFCCLIFLLAFQCIFAQEKAKAVLIDDFSDQGYDQIRGRIDNLLVEIRKNSNSKGSIVIYGSKKFPLNKYFHEIQIKKHIEYRNFDMSRIVFLHGEDGNDGKYVRTQLWLIPSGADFPLFSEGDWNYKLPETTKPFIFHRNSWIYEVGFETFSLEFYSKFLKADSSLNSNLVVYEKSFGDYHLAVNKLRKDLVNKYGVRPKQLNFFFTKSNKSDVEFWFVPRK